jgi:ATP-binding cassette subfamily C (CFTR/MRP) protein 1
MSFKKAKISRSPETEAVLHDFNLSTPRRITIVIGPVGCGKSTLIESILGGNTLKSISATVPLSGVAYCPQTTWILNNTIRHNIIGASEFDQKWYYYTCTVCGLEGDPEVIPGGDIRMASSTEFLLAEGRSNEF